MNNLITNHATPANPAARWSREQIRAARKVPLMQLLQARGMQLRALDAGNFTLPGPHAGILLKVSNWPTASTG